MAKGRTAGFQMGAEHRTKIGNSKILKHLIEHATGERDMSSTQVTAAIALLRKVMPDLSNVEMGGEVKHSYVARLPEPVDSMDEWQKQTRTLIN